MKRRKFDQSFPDIEAAASAGMTPMIDVTFLLLIFFLCTLRFRSLEGRVEAFLPKGVGQNTEETEPDLPIEVRLDVVQPGTPVRADTGAPWAGVGEARWVGRVLRTRIGPADCSDPAVLASRLEALWQADHERAVRVDARPGTLHREVVRLVDRVLSVGFDELSFAPATKSR